MDNNDHSALIPGSARQLRIAIISDAESERNGVGAYYHDLADQLRNQVAKIELFCPGAPGINHRISIPLPGDATQKIWLPPIRQVSTRVKALKPHIIIVPTPGPFGLLAAHLARKHQARLVVGFHTHFEKIMDLYWSRWFGYLTVRYFEILNRYLFRKADVILANSNEMAAIARQRSQRRVELMGTPIPLDFLETPTQPFRGKLNSILYAGRLAAEKNIESVIDAAEQHRELHFYIAGDGPIRDEVKQAESRLPNLKYLGWLNRTDMLDIIDSTDMLVLPSHVESFGTIAMEAMARGRIVLVSSQCGILGWQILQPGLLQIPADGTVSSTIETIKKMDPGQLRNKSEKARSGAAKFSQWNIDNWLRLLTQENEAK